MARSSNDIFLLDPALVSVVESVRTNEQKDYLVVCWSNMPDPWGVEDQRLKTGFTNDCTILISQSEFSVIGMKIVTFCGLGAEGKSMCARASACMSIHSFLFVLFCFVLFFEAVLELTL